MEVSTCRRYDQIRKDLKQIGFELATNSFDDFLVTNGYGSTRRFKSLSDVNQFMQKLKDSASAAFWSGSDGLIKIAQ